MSDQVWYVYQAGNQIGPFDTAQVTSMVSSKMIAQDAYLFKVGWKDWQPLEATFEELGLPASQEPVAQARITGAPRASISGRVIVHNNGQIVIGSGVNISGTGMFVETKDQIFTVGEMLKLSVRCEGMSKAFNAVAQVIRYNLDQRWPTGYGLRFVSLNEESRAEIEALVKDQNQSATFNSVNRQA